MVDVLVLIALIALPVVSWLLSRSLLFVAVWIGLGVGVAGNVVQGSIALGASWNVRGLQGLLIVIVGGVTIAAWRRRSRADVQSSLRRQLAVVVLPAVVIGGYLIMMRLLAPENPGALTAVGYLINHPQAEDNAKWLNLSAQLADGRDIAFSGYAGGPLLLVMSGMAALISVLSLILLGGVNQVAVAANTVVGTQFLLIALVPFALAVFAERRFRVGAEAQRLWLPAPLVWISMLVAVLASAVVTSYGHLSWQFILLVLIAWVAVFALRAPRSIRLATSLTLVTSASVWLPLTAIAGVVVVGALVWTIRARWWVGLGLTLATALASLDALLSSGLYVLGVDLTALPLVGGGTESREAGADVSAVGSEVIASAHLFRAPGATEITGPLLAGLAIAALMGAVWLVSRRGSAGVAFAPVVALGGYVAVIAVGDAISTGSAPNYAVHKLLFAVVVAIVAALLPITLFSLDAGDARMTALRWAGLGAVLLLLIADSLLPRALSALSPVLWSGVDSNSPSYWSAAEVKPVPEQPLTSVPVGCLFAPPVAEAPTALPLGQESYACTRLLVGLTGQEDTLRGLPILVQTDWISQRSNWSELAGLVQSDAERLPGRSVIVMKPDGGLAGITPLDQLVARNPS